MDLEVDLNISVYYGTMNNNFNLVNLSLNHYISENMNLFITMKWAVYRNHPKIVQNLIHVNFPIQKKSELLTEACWHGRTKLVEFLLNHYGVTDVIEHLNIAVRKGYFKITKLLLDYSKYPICIEEYYLDEIVRKGFVKVIKLLIERGYTKYLSSDLYVLSEAILNRHYKVAELLLQNGSDPNNSRNSPFIYSCANLDIKYVKLLSHYGADIHEGTEEGLHQACLNGKYETIKFLIERGASLKENLNLNLRWCCKYGFADIAKIFIDAGANVHHRNDISLRWAKERGHMDTIHLLEGEI